MGGLWGSATTAAGAGGAEGAAAAAAAAGSGVGGASLATVEVGQQHGQQQGRIWEEAGQEAMESEAGGCLLVSVGGLPHHSSAFVRPCWCDCSLRDPLSSCVVVVAAFGLCNGF